MCVCFSEWRGEYEKMVDLYISFLHKKTERMHRIGLSIILMVFGKKLLLMDYQYKYNFISSFRKCLQNFLSFRVPFGASFSIAFKLIGLAK